MDLTQHFGRCAVSYPIEEMSWEPVSVSIGE
jgi:hypothetical protein